MKIYRLFIPPVAMFLFVSCEKDLDMKYHDIPPLTVIEGVLTPEGVKTGITMTTPMDEPMDRMPVTDASVTLTDLTAGTSRDLPVDTEGYFSADRGGMVGHRYRLTVEREGNRYEAETVMYPPTELISLGFSWIRMPYDHVAVLQGQFADISDEEEYYWVKIYRNGEMYSWMQVSDRAAADNVVTFILMTTRMDTAEEEDDTVLYDGDMITVTVSVISKEMYDYLEALQNDSNGPAMFTGSRCLGYFMATSPVSDTIVFHPDEIPGHD